MLHQTQHMCYRLKQMPGTCHPAKTPGCTHSASVFCGVVGEWSVVVVVVVLELSAVEEQVAATTTGSSSTSPPLRYASNNGTIVTTEELDAFVS